MIGWITRWIVAIGLFAGALYLCFAAGAAWLAIAVGAIALLITMIAMASGGGHASYGGHACYDEDDHGEA